MTRNREFTLLLEEIQKSKNETVRLEAKLSHLRSTCPHDWGRTEPVFNQGHYETDVMSRESRQVWIPDTVVGHKRTCQICLLEQKATAYEEKVSRMPVFPLK